MWPRLFWSKANSPSAPPNGATFLVLSRYWVSNTRRDWGRVVSFNGDDCDFSEVAWIGSLNLETECNKILPWIRMLFSVTCSDLPCFFFRSPTLRFDRTQTTRCHRIRRRRLKSWVPGCRRMLVAGEGQVFLDKQIRPIFHRSAGLLVAHCKVKNHKVKTWHESWKNMKKHY